MKNCLFCKIINKEIASEIVYEDEKIIAFKDIHPKAPYHFLVFPKKHIISMAFLQDQDFDLVKDMAKIAKELSLEISKEKGLSEPIAFNIISNNGAESGQSVFHIHWHFLAGKNLFTSGLKL